MKETPYAIVGSWHQAIKGLQQSRPSAMLGGVMATTVIWLIASLYQGFSVSALVRSGIPIPILAGVAAVFWGMTRSRSGPKRHRLALARINALVGMMYPVLFLLTLSGYFLIIALGIANTSRGIPSTYPTLTVALYVLSAIAAIVWSPRSLPRSKSDDEMAFARSAKWLPWLIGMQGTLVGIGVFLGVFAARSQSSWGMLALGGLGTLGALLCVTFSILLLYRFVFLALQPVPLELQEEFGLRD